MQTIHKVFENTADGPGRTSGRNNLIGADYLLAVDSLTPPRELVLLARSKKTQVRARVAENPNCPAAIVAELSRDPEAEVRTSVAQNPKVSALILEQLLEDVCADIPFAMAEDHNLEPSLLWRLTQHDNPYVSERARKTLERLRAALFDHQSSIEVADSIYCCVLNYHELPAIA